MKRIVISSCGKRFGRLVVVKEFRQRGVSKKGKNFSVIKATCECDCGNITVVNRGSLISGNTSSCGCFKKEKLSYADGTYRTLPSGEAAFNNLYYSYKCNAKYRNIVWNISMDDFKSITSSKCFYCNSDPLQRATQKIGARDGKRENVKNINGEYFYNGIDRIDSLKGYTADNSIPCCGKCNKIKSKMEIEKFYFIIKKIYNNLILTNFGLPTNVLKQ